MQVSEVAKKPETSVCVETKFVKETKTGKSQKLYREMGLNNPIFVSETRQRDKTAKQNRETRPRDETVRKDREMRPQDETGR